jgi:vacuolar iron transporter family protein
LRAHHSFESEAAQDSQDAPEEEITEHHIYTALSAAVKDPHNRDILLRMAREDYEHYVLWKHNTQESVSPDQEKICF